MWSLRLNTREPPLSMNSLCKMLKVAQWFLRRRSSDVVNVFMPIFYAFEKWRDRLKKMLKSGPVVLEKKVFRCCHYIHVTPLKKNVTVWRKSNYLHCIVNTSFGEGNSSFFVVLAKKSMQLSIFSIYLHSKQMWPFILTNLKSIQPQMLCVKFGWNRPSGSVEEDFKMSSIFFMLFRYYLPLEKGTALYLK